MKRCSIKKCNNAFYGLRFCRLHYKRFKKKGDPLAFSCRDKNKFFLKNNIVYVKLTDINGNFLKCAKIDKEFLYLIKRYKWNLSTNGYVYNNKAGYLHKNILKHKKGFVCDHINMIPTDNRLENLRHATKRQNTLNTTKVKGFSYNKRMKKWEAYLGINRTKRHLGFFKTKKQARLKRKEYAKDFI